MPHLVPLLSIPAIEVLIDRYLEGDTQAAEALLSAFEPYLQRWLNLLLKGRWRSDDEELMQFLGFFSKVDAQSAASILVRRLKAYEPEDLKQEVQIALLETFRRYRNVRATYRYVLKERLWELTRDPLIRALPEPWADELPTEVPLGLSEIDEDWVRGLTCGPGFDRLTERQRWVLQLHKNLGHPLELVAEEVQVSVRTVKRDLQSARSVLERYYLRK